MQMNPLIITQKFTALNWSYLFSALISSTQLLSLSSTLAPNISTQFPSNNWIMGSLKCNRIFSPVVCCCLLLLLF